MSVLTSKRYLYNLESYQGKVLRFAKTKYTDNDTLAVVAFIEVDDGLWEIYDMVTVNLGDTPNDDIQFIHVNHWAEGFVDWLTLIGAGQPTSVYRQSGFVQYPQFRFNPEFLDSMGETTSSMVIDNDNSGELIEIDRDEFKKTSQVIY